MNVSSEIISQILASQDLQPYLDAGFDAAWVADRAGGAGMFFDGNKIHDRDAYEYIVEHHARHGRVPPVEMFRKNFPTFRLSEESYKPSELIEEAHKTVRRYQVLRLENDLIDRSESGDFDGVPALLREYADRLSATRSGPGVTNSWEPVDLAPYLRGEVEPLVPAICARADGEHLFYRGKTHAISSETEGGKTWLALFACAQEIDAGHDVTYLDFEDGPDGIMERLAELVADPSAILQHFRYIRPEGPLKDVSGLAQMTRECRLVIVDGVTEAMTMHGLNPLDNSDIAKFNGLLINPVANSGPAVVSLDHVVKDAKSRGRYQIGGVHKANGITGVSYLLVNEEPFGRGMAGKSRLLAAKDRPGHVRQHGIRYESKDPAVRYIADLIVNNRDPEVATEVRLTPPAESGEWRPSHLMAKASRLLAQGAERYSKSSLADRMGGNAKNAKDAINFLVTDGYAEVAIEGRTHYLNSLKRYNEPLDV